MKKFLLIAVLAISVLAMACTENSRVRYFGGSMVVALPEGRKLVTVTFKESNIWYLTRPMREDEKAETYEFKEDSEFGLSEGVITFIEKR